MVNGLRNSPKAITKESTAARRAFARTPLAPDSQIGLTILSNGPFTINQS